MDTGTLVRFNRETNRFMRSSKSSGFAPTKADKTVEVPKGTFGIVIGKTMSGNRDLKPVVFTSLGFRVCEHEENLEVVCRP